MTSLRTGLQEVPAKAQRALGAIGAPPVVMRLANRAPRPAYELLSPQGREVRAARRALARRYLSGDGLELGALNLPLPLPRGARARYVDRMGAAELRAEYPEWAAWNVVDPDVIDDGETLATVADASVGFVVANHFIEHTQDPIATLKNHLRVLRPGGVLFMAVPDQRHTPDASRATTPITHLVQDHVEGPERSRMDHYGEYVRSWERLDGPAADSRARDLSERDFSIHFHTWTPNAFAELIVHCQRALGLPSAIEALQPVRHEFITILRKQAA
jgi:SAM-dependent methyltransferase